MGRSGEGTLCEGQVRDLGQVSEPCGKVRWLWEGQVREPCGKVMTCEAREPIVNGFKAIRGVF